MVFSVLFLRADETTRSFKWTPPKVVESIFTRKLEMMDAERDDYSTNLATYASNAVIDAKASEASLEQARRVLGLALQLSPRNKQALVVCFKLARGVMPEKVQSSYSQYVMGRLLLTRGELLDKQEGEENRCLGRYFIGLAAEMDPKNDDAVYASEVQRLDLGPLDWTRVTDSAGKKH